MYTVPLTNVLSKGTKVSTLLESNYLWQQNTIKKIDGNLIYLSLIDPYIKALIIAGNNISIKYSTEYFEYIFHGSIYSVEANNQKCIIVNIVKSTKKINTRAFTRYDIYLPSSIKHQCEKASYFSIITNLSLNGMAFTSNHDFNCEDICDASIQLPDATTLKLSGTITRKTINNNLIDYGMHFNDINEANNKILADYILSLENGFSKLQTLFND